MRQTRILDVIAGILFAAIPGSASFSQAQAPSPSATPTKVATPASVAEVAAIQAGSVAFVSAFNQRDAKAIAAFWTKDGEYVDESGRSYVGRDAIEKGYTEIFAGLPDSKMRLMIDSIRLLSDSAAIEDGRAVVEPAPAGGSGISSYTVVHVKVDGKWLMASVRDTGSEDASMSNDLADLEWLIGDWTAEEHGARTESKCRWMSNKKFVERSYTTTQIDGSSTSGLQIFGWNPQADHMQSWSFSADGGHAIGVLSAVEGGWIAEVNGTTGEGVRTTAINSLKRLDDNAYVWQSMNRTLGGTVLPDTDEVIMRRKSAAR